MQAKQAGPDATMDWAPDLASTTKQHGMTITTRNGRRLLASLGPLHSQLWARENFLP